MAPFYCAWRSVNRLCVQKLDGGRARGARCPNSGLAPGKRRASRPTAATSAGRIVEGMRCIAAGHRFRHPIRRPEPLPTVCEPSGILRSMRGTIGGSFEPDPSGASMLIADSKAMDRADRNRPATAPLVAIGVSKYPAPPEGRRPRCPPATHRARTACRVALAQRWPSGRRHAARISFATPRLRYRWDPGCAHDVGRPRAPGRS